MSKGRPVQPIYLFWIYQPSTNPDSWHPFCIIFLSKILRWKLDLLIRFLPPIPTQLPFIQPHPNPTRIRVAGQATIPPSQRSGGCGKWDAVVILKNRNKREETQCHSLLAWHIIQGEKQENVGELQFIQPLMNWQELAQTPYYSCIHCPPCLAMGIVRQGLQVCPPGKRFKSINTNNLDKF